MTKLNPDIIGRVKRLPSPSNWRSAMMPIFEAVMNGLQAIQDAGSSGKVNVSIELNDNDIIASISDNGIGLNEENWEAFKQLDTCHKISRGGKGVGRLLWLASFKTIRVYSYYIEEKKLQKLSFSFQLDNENPIIDDNFEEATDAKETGTTVILKSINHDYMRQFPKEAEKIIEGFVSHFWPIIVSNNNLDVNVEVKIKNNNFTNKNASIRSTIEEITLRESKEMFSIQNIGNFSIHMMECSNKVIGGEKKKNHIFYTAHQRIVSNQPVDDLLGIEYIDKDRKTVLRAILTGSYLDNHVNQERTDFVFSKDVRDKITRETKEHLEKFVSEAIGREREKQKKALKDILNEYPSLRVLPEEKLLLHLKPSQKDKEQIFNAISTQRYRADQRQKKAIREVLEKAREKGVRISVDLKQEIKQQMKNIEESSRNELAEYVIRRHTLLDMLDILLRNNDGGPGLEAALHTLIAPRNQATIGRNPAPVAHDLWIVDESFVFTQSLVSDVQMRSIINESHTSKAADIIIFDKMLTFSESIDTPRKVYILEFKRPNRRKLDKSIKKQLLDYIDQLKGGTLEGAAPRVRVPEDAFFSCYIIADIIGDLEDETRDWPNGIVEGGKQYQFPTSGPYRGAIEIIPWDRLLNAAKARNRAFFERLGLPVT